MSYVYNINETISSKRVINVNSKNSKNVSNEKNSFKHNKVNSFENPKMNEIVLVIPKKESFFCNKLNAKKFKNNLCKEDFSKALKKCKYNKKYKNNNKFLNVNKYKESKYINKHRELLKFKLFYDKKNDKSFFVFESLKNKSVKIDNLLDDIKRSKIISNILMDSKSFKENFDKRIKSVSKNSHHSFYSNHNKFVKIYNSKKINLYIGDKNKNIKYNLVKNFEDLKKLNKNKLYKDVNIIKDQNISKDNKVLNNTLVKPEIENKKFFKKVPYEHDAKIVYMRGVPKHNRCYEKFKEVPIKVKNNEKIEEIDDDNNKWKLLNDANESYPLVKFGKEIRNHFDYLNRNNEENLHKVFMSELGHVEMSINGKSITENKSPKEVLKKFTSLLPNISDRKLVSCFAQEGVLAKAFFGVIAKNPDILKYTFYHPKISYKINRINENSFEVDICSITRSRNFDSFDNKIGIPYKNQKIHSYGMKTNVVFSKISNPIIKNLFFVK